MALSNKQWKEIFKRTDAKLTYSEISAKMEEILRMDENVRLESFKNYYLDLFCRVYKGGLELRIREDNQPTFRGRFVNKNLIEPTTFSKDVFRAMKSMLREKNPELVEKIPDFFGATNMERNDALWSVGSQFGALENLQKSGREQKITLLNAVVEDLLQTVPQRRFDLGDLNTKQKEIAELFVIYEQRRAQFEENLAKGGWRWKLRNFLEIPRTRKFIKNCESLFQKAGLDVAAHGEKIKEMYSKSVYGLVYQQMDIAKNYYKNLQKKEDDMKKAQSVEQLTVAQEKYKAALKQNENPETSIVTKVTPYIEKHGIDTGMNGLRFPYPAYSEAATKFDTLRDTESLKSAIRQRFLDIYGNIARGTIRKNGSIDPKVVLEDTQAILDMELHHCTILYDRPETKELAENNVYANLSVPLLQRRMVQAVNGYRNEQGQPMSAEEKDAISRAVEEIVTQAREANAKAKENEQNLEQKNDTEIKNPESEKVPISIPHLKESTVNIELSERIPDATVFEKESVSKI